MVLVSPWAAVLTNRTGVGTLLIGAQGSSALIAAYMAWRYHSGLLALYTLMFGALALGLAYPGSPRPTGLLPELVDPADATDAVKMNSVSYNTGEGN